MAPLRNRRKLAAVSRETPENPMKSQSLNTLDPGMAQEYISQVSGEIEGRVTEELFEEFSRTESRIFGSFSKLDKFLLNPQVRTCSVAVPRISRNNNSENQDPTGDRSPVNSCPEAVSSACYPGFLNDSEQDEAHHMVTVVQEEIPYCSRGTSSEKQKKGRTASQPEFRDKNTPATIEADQFLLALQQLVTISNSATLDNNINRISKLPKSLTMTMPTFDGKSDIFELFESLFQTSLKFHIQLTEEEKTNYFHSLMRGDALQTFENITSLNTVNLGESLTVFRRKYVKPQSLGTAKHIFRQPVFNSANQKLIDFLHELPKLAKDEFGVAAQAIIEQFIYAQMPSHLKKSLNKAHLVNDT